MPIMQAVVNYWSNWFVDSLTADFFLTVLKQVNYFRNVNRYTLQDWVHTCTLLYWIINISFWSFFDSDRPTSRILKKRALEHLVFKKTFFPNTYPIVIMKSLVFIFHVVGQLVFLVGNTNNFIYFSPRQNLPGATPNFPRTSFTGSDIFCTHASY